MYGKIVKWYEDNDGYYNVVIKDKVYELIVVNFRVRDFFKVDYNFEKNRYLIVYFNIVYYF